MIAPVSHYWTEVIKHGFTHQSNLDEARITVIYHTQIFFFTPSLPTKTKKNILKRYSTLLPIREVFWQTLESGTALIPNSTGSCFAFKL